MSNELILWKSQESLEDIRKIYGKDLTDGEWFQFAKIGRETGLNPYLREIWAIKYWSKKDDKYILAIFVGRDGYRKSAQANAEYDYHQVDAVYSNDEFGMHDGQVLHRYKLNNRGDLLGAYCIAKRKSAEKAMFCFVEFKEYGKDKKFVWGEKPATMIKKVAEAQGLRMAFQELFAGTYNQYESWITQEDLEAKDVTPAKPRGVEQLKAYLGIASVDTVMEKIKDATNIDELNSTVPLARELPEEEKVILRDLYTQKKQLLINQRSTNNVAL